MGGDLQARVDDLADDYDISSHKAGLRAMDRGLQVLGYAEVDSEETAIGAAAAEGGRLLAVAGVVFALGTSMPVTLGYYVAAVCLACAVVGLLVDRAEPGVSNMLGVPADKQHPEVVADGGGKQ